MMLASGSRERAERRTTTRIYVRSWKKVTCSAYGGPVELNSQ
jgi:hypothetical protein